MIKNFINEVNSYWFFIIITVLFYLNKVAITIFSCIDIYQYVSSIKEQDDYIFVKIGSTLFNEQ